MCSGSRGLVLPAAPALAGFAAVRCTSPQFADLPVPRAMCGSPRRTLLIAGAAGSKVCPRVCAQLYCTYEKEKIMEVGTLSFR